MQDFLKGMFGKLLQVILALLGIGLFIAGLISCASSHSVASGICLFLSLLCWCAIFGIRYWLGHIVRMR